MGFHIWKNFSFISSYTFSVPSPLFEIPINIYQIAYCPIVYVNTNFFYFFLSSFCVSFDFFFSCVATFIVTLFFTVLSIVMPIQLIFHFGYYPSQVKKFHLIFISSISFLIKTIVSFTRLNIIINSSSSSILTLKSSFVTSIIFSFLHLVLLIEIFFMIIFASKMLYIVNALLLSVQILFNSFKSIKVCFDRKLSFWRQS